MLFILHLADKRNVRMPQPEPDQCWALERVPWWEPPYILHLRRQEVKLGRSQENNKVCRGYLVSRHHALFIRWGHIRSYYGGVNAMLPGPGPRKTGGRCAGVSGTRDRDKEPS